MIIYVACCKTLEEAHEVQNKLFNATATLVYSRILKHVRELDAYDSDVFTAMDEQAKVGQLAFGNGFRYSKRVWGNLLGRVMTVFAAVAVLTMLGARFLGSPWHSPLALGLLAALLLLGGTLLIAASMRAFKLLTPDRTAFVHAANALKHRRPVVIAGSDNPPEKPELLSINVIYFDHQSTSSAA